MAVDLQKVLTPRLSELGKIKIGGLGETRTSKSGGTYRVPVKYDHFVITTLARDKQGALIPDDELMAQLVASDDGKIRDLPIMVLSDDIGEILVAQHTLYKGKSCWARCDGETCTWLGDPRSGERFDKPREYPCEGEHEREPWKLHGSFACVIVAGAARLGGVYKLRTTSRITLEQLYGSLLHIQQITGGVLQGVPLRLVVRPILVAPKGEATTVYVVHAEIRGTDINAIQQEALQLAQMRVAHAHQIAAARAQYRRMLAAPGVDEDPIEQADIAQEFAPEEEPAPPDAPAPEPEPPAPPPEDEATAAVRTASERRKRAAKKRRAGKRRKTKDEAPAPKTEVLNGSLF